MAANSEVHSFFDKESPRRTILQGLGIGSALILGGCGGSGGSSSGSKVTATSASSTPAPTSTPTSTATSTPTPTATTTTTTTSSYGTTGWNAPGYVATAITRTIADFVAIAAASYTFHEANTLTGTAETVQLSAYLMSKYQVTNANWKAYCVATGTRNYR